MNLEEFDKVNDNVELVVSEDGHKVRVLSMFAVGNLTYPSTLKLIPYGSRLLLKNELNYLKNHCSFHFSKDCLTIYDYVTEGLLMLPCTFTETEGRIWLQSNDVDDQSIKNIYLYSESKEGLYMVRQSRASILCVQDLKDYEKDITDDGATHMEDIPTTPGHYGGNEKDPKQEKLSFQKS